MRHLQDPELLWCSTTTTCRSPAGGAASPRTQPHAAEPAVAFLSGSAEEAGEDCLLHGSLRLSSNAQREHEGLACQGGALS